MNQDTLSEVLRHVRLRGALFYYVNYGPEWAAEVPSVREIAPAVMPGVEHVMEFHLLAKGAGWAAVVGQPPVRVQAGDIVMFPHGDAHVMSSAPGMRGIPIDVDWVYATRRHPKPITLSYPDASSAPSDQPMHNAAVNVVCGFLGCDLRPFNPLIETLPRLLHIPSGGEGDWVTRTVHQAVLESQKPRPGGAAVLERMSEMMFVDAIRRYLDSLPAESTGWLAGLRDRHVGRALALLHQRPTESWTIEGLGREAGLSRSALHERFTQLIGQPPMQYLTHWRMQLAANLLRQSHATVASIAVDVGYDSEAAFARAFKRLVGLPPAAWRRQCAVAPQTVDMA